jgi:hypothetical protein
VSSFSIFYNDEKIWSEPEKFNSERFMEDGANIMGSDLR